MKIVRNPGIESTKINTKFIFFAPEDGADLAKEWQDVKEKGSDVFSAIDNLFGEGVDFLSKGKDVANNYISNELEETKNSIKNTRDNALAWGNTQTERAEKSWESNISQPAKQHYQEAIAWKNESVATAKQSATESYRDAVTFKNESIAAGQQAWESNITQPVVEFRNNVVEFQNNTTAAIDHYNDLADKIGNNAKYLLLHAEELGTKLDERNAKIDAIADHIKGASEAESKGDLVKNVVTKYQPSVSANQWPAVNQEMSNALGIPNTTVRMKAVQKFAGISLEDRDGKLGTQFITAAKNVDFRNFA